MYIILILFLIFQIYFFNPLKENINISTIRQLKLYLNKDKCLYFMLIYKIHIKYILSIYFLTLYIMQLNIKK
jgi:hypothetical protein